MLPWVGSIPPFDKQVTLVFLILSLEFGWLLQRSMDSLIVPLGCCSSYSRRIDYSFSSCFLPFGRVFLGLSSLWIPGESSCLSETLELNQIRNLMADFLRALPGFFFPLPHGPIEVVFPIILHQILP